MKVRFSVTLYYFLLILVLFSRQAHGQILINEISSSNISIVQNANGNYNDWIELINAGSSDINIQDYGLTDDIASPFKFRFPSHILSPGETVIVFASDSINDEIDHYEMPVDASSMWKYCIGSATMDTNWRNISYNDVSWTNGYGGMGFSDEDDGTTIPVSISVMMRKSFSIEDTSNISNAVFMMDYDDGFAAYLNGVEIARVNLAAGFPRPAWNSLAFNAHEAQIYQGHAPDSFFINSEVLKTLIRPGLNVLAVETHDFTNDPTDMTSRPYLFFGMKNDSTVYPPTPSWFNYQSSGIFNVPFKLSRTGETVFLVRPSGSIGDQVTYPVLENDHTYGRIPDGVPVFCYIGTPTPNASNNTSGCSSGYATNPILNRAPGYYTSPQTLTMSSSIPGSTIRYSVNGDVPDSNSYIYTAPISIDSTCTIRARVFAPGVLPSNTVTNTYFIDEDTRLSVFCITTDSLNLWDYNTGIYVLGPNASSTPPYFGANFWQQWQKPAYIEFFDKSRNRVLNFNADLEIYGNYSRAKPQKSFEIRLSDRNGEDEVNFAFIPDKSFITEYDKIIVRNAGTDWNKVHFRDALMERIMKNTYSGYVGAEPTIVYLNGDFWGVYFINEKHNANWITANYGYKKDEIDYVEEIGSAIVVATGSDRGFWELYNYATSSNPLSEEYFNYIDNKIDLKNYTDYFIAETYYNNGDWIGEWTNNIKIWKPKENNGKWRYIMHDLDYGLGLIGSVTDNRLDMMMNPIEKCNSSEIFNSVIKNPVYRKYFINRYADLINTIYQPANVEDVMKSFRDTMAHDMIAHFDKWGRDMHDWDEEIEEMMEFVEYRVSIVRDQIENQFELNGQVTLSVNAYPPGSGRIEISTVIPSAYPWSGVYFNGNPVTITAIPNPGYTFDHWNSDITIINDTNQRTTYNFTSDDEIVAYFSGTPAVPKITISEINYNSNAEFMTEDWIELHNYGNFSLDISGWKISDEMDNHKFKVPTGTVIPPNGYFVFSEDLCDFNVFFPAVNNVTGPLEFGFENNGGQIRVFNHNDSLIISMYYADNLPWPAEADGDGYTCELLNINGSLNDGNNWFDGCFGGSPGVGYSSNLSAVSIINGNSKLCTDDVSYMSIANVTGFTYQWIHNDVLINGANSSSYQTMTSGVYNVEVEVNGCSGISLPFEVVNLTPATPPDVKDGVRCGAGQLLLSANSEDSVYWYESPFGKVVGEGKSFMTPYITQSTVYFAIANKFCSSIPVPATAYINTGECEGSLSVYPNPSRNSNAIAFSEDLEQGPASLTFTDMNGQVVWSKNFIVPPDEKSFDIYSLHIEPGIYVVQMQQGGKVMITKYVRL